MGEFSPVKVRFSFSNRTWTPRSVKPALLQCPQRCLRPLSRLNSADGGAAFGDKPQYKVVCDVVTNALSGDALRMLQVDDLGYPQRRRLTNYFFDGAIASLAAFATRNFTAVLALILIDSPV